MEWWNSIGAVARFTRTAAVAAVVLLMLGAITFPVTWIVAIPAIVAGMTAILCAMFAWFRLDHLRETERQP